jgi:SAM-dependent methyltransferase
MMPELNTKQYWDNRLKDNWGPQGVGYLQLGQFFNVWMYQIRKNIFFRNVKPLVRNWGNKDVLDIGSGTGFYINLWKSLKVNSVTATDISTHAINNLQEIFPDIDCFEIDISDSLPDTIREKKFHVVSAFDVLFHIVDDRKYENSIGNIFDMLNPGGYFIFSENFLQGKTLRKAGQVSRSQNDIESGLRKAGFKTILHVPMFVIMNYPMDSKNRFYKRSWGRTMSIVERFPAAGIIMGGIMFPFELALTSKPKDSPSTELMICVKPIN